jgi:hypothetical protein
MNTLQWPLVRNYSDLDHFPQENIDLFYDYVERMYHLVFVTEFIPNTKNKRRYMDNPQIIAWNFQTNIDVHDEHAFTLKNNSYFFEVAHTLTYSKPRQYTVSCLLRIYLKPCNSRHLSCKPLIYLHIRDRQNAPGLPDIHIECFNNEIYRGIENLSKSENALRDDPLNTYVDIIHSQDYVNIFQIWLSISKKDKIPIHIKTEYKYKYCEYFKSLVQLNRFKTVTMPAFANVMIPDKGPSHQTRPYFTQAVSEGLILDMIRQQGLESWFPDLMQKLFQH